MDASTMKVVEMRKVVYYCPECHHQFIANLECMEVAPQTTRCHLFNESGNPCAGVARFKTEFRTFRRVPKTASEMFGSEGDENG